MRSATICSPYWPTHEARQEPGVLNLAGRFVLGAKYCARPECGPCSTETRARRATLLRHRRRARRADTIGPAVTLDTFTPATPAPIARARVPFYTPTNAQTVACPACPASPGERCSTRTGYSAPDHPTRFLAAVRARNSTTQPLEA